MRRVPSKQWQLCGLRHSLSHALAFTSPSTSGCSRGIFRRFFSGLNRAFCSKWEQREEAGVGVNHNSWFIDVKEINLIVKEMLKLLLVSQISTSKSASLGCISLFKKQSQ